MSWSATGTSLTPEQIEELPEPVFQTENETESREQFNTALAIAGGIAHAGVVGDHDSHVFNVSLAGHANPDHEKAEGWSNDYMTITVTQA